MTAKPQDMAFVDIRTPGMKGWNTLNDPSIIEDLELVEAVNLQYDNGFLRPREGKTLITVKPTGETAAALQLMGTRTSDGVYYKIGVYGNKFYLWHPENEEWIRINQTYVPTETTIRYGFITWNNGRSDDRLYFCNGVDNFARWDLCVTTASGAQSSGGTTLTVADNTRFPSTGTLVIKGDAGVFTEAYTAKVGTTGFTLTNTLDDGVADGASVTIELQEKSGMEVGRILGKHQGRLFVLNYYGGETTGWYSKQADPENFTTGSAVPDASTFVISDGNGGITGFHDFGEFAVIEKEDSVHNFRIQLAEDLGSKLDAIKPIISGESVGPVNHSSVVKVHNTLMFPTTNNGFLSFYPTGTGDSVTVQKQTISMQIQPFVKRNISTAKCVGAAVGQKVFWTVAERGSVQNTIILMHDLERNAWSKWDNIAALDFVVEDDEFFYLDSGSGAVFKLLNRDYNDNGNPYQVTAALKRFDFGKMSKPKAQDKIYVQGYMTPKTELFVDIYFNEEGFLGKQTYRIDKDTEGVILSDPLTNAAGQFIAGQPPAGWVIGSEIGELSFFRCFLGISSNKGYFNLQPVFRSYKQAFWGVTGMSFNPIENEAIPIGMTISPISTE